jgi:[lysine-biosynthesis-protein LysW]--L-2-aminoadipate ligase
MAVIAIIAHRAGDTNGALVDAWRDLGIDARLVAPEAAPDLLGPGDTALLRLDVSQELDGIEPGLDFVPELRLLGVRILNNPWALIGAHDKLETVHRLAEAGLPHPRTTHVVRPDADVETRVPVVVKPRHGSWGRDVRRCASEESLRACLRTVEGRSWFRTHGALVQELVQPVRHDLRLIVAGAEVVGAAERRPRRGEWRTNVSLGGALADAVPDGDARRLALAAAAAVGADLVGIDLLPLPGGGYTVLELNGAVDFDDRYSLPGAPIFPAAARALGLVPGGLRRSTDAVGSAVAAFSG